MFVHKVTQWLSLLIHAINNDVTRGKVKWSHNCFPVTLLNLSLRNLKRSIVN